MISRLSMFYKTQGIVLEFGIINFIIFFNGMNKENNNTILT